MSLNQPLLAEFKQEKDLTRKILERVPFDRPQWKPHEKSMTIQRLASHISELPRWMGRTLESDAFDLAATTLERFHAQDNAELLQKYQDCFTEAYDLLAGASDELLLGNWSMKRGDQVFYTMTRAAMIRRFVLSHTIHHRGQLSVYLRLLDVPVPGMYGPSADER